MQGTSCVHLNSPRLSLSKESFDRRELYTAGTTFFNSSKPYGTPGLGCRNVFEGLSHKPHTFLVMPCCIITRTTSLRRSTSIDVHLSIGISSMSSSTMIPPAPTASSAITSPIDDYSSETPRISEGTKKKTQKARARKTYTKAYLTPTPCKDGDQHNFHCPAMPPPGEFCPRDRVQCAPWHTREGLFDHLFVFPPYL